jgi:hypothetical protein
MLPKMTGAHSFLWLNNVPGYMYSIYLSIDQLIHAEVVSVS